MIEGYLNCNDAGFNIKLYAKVIPSIETHICIHIDDGFSNCFPVGSVIDLSEPPVIHINRLEHLYYSHALLPPISSGWAVIREPNIIRRVY